MSGNLPKPIGKQREVLYLPVTGHSAVLGTAGSGKTTLALYRAAFLSEPSMPHAGKTLLLTFNKTLVTYLNYLKPPELRNVQIETYHAFARGYLNNRGKMQNNCICSDDERRVYVLKAVKNVELRYKPSNFFKRSIEFFMDEIQWIFSHGITSSDEYVKVERVGRFNARLLRGFRSVMYEILEKYVELRNQKGKMYDWDDLALYVRKEFEIDSSIRMYKHIIIDEGQDFSPEMIRSLVAAIPKDGSLSFFGDVAQQIYGQRMSWRSSGLNIPQQWLFKENYRNTKQIAQLGLSISRMPFFNDIPDLVEPTSARADGSLPTLVKCSNVTHQVELALTAARRHSVTQSVAILVKNREQEKVFDSQLGTDATRLHRDLVRWKNSIGIYHGTYHSAKGLEFDVVILPFLDSVNLPDKNHLDFYGEEDGLTYGGRLLYVAVTRAKSNLILLYSDELTSLLPVDRNLYREVSL
jgi:superfamily I DNA/RNA helicase